MDGLWEQCNGKHAIAPLQETAWRLIEAQHILATRKLVDSAAEQMILEEMIEAVKPALGRELIGLHPLLATPFRYPPLKYGSRFGTRSEPSLWYGSLQLTTAMTEKAFYQFNFVRASAADFGMIEVALTAFATTIQAHHGIDLRKPPFAKHTPTISSPSHYHTSQQLGRAMRQADIDAFCYQSARGPSGTTNIALFTPQAFKEKKPLAASFQTWQCIINSVSIEFIRSSALENTTITYTINTFLINGCLPFPAN